jgi:hypothetical protein
MYWCLFRLTVIFDGVAMLTKSCFWFNGTSLLFTGEGAWKSEMFSLRLFELSAR